MEIKQLYKEVLNEHNLNPQHKKPLSGATLELRGVNPSCGDNIFLQLKLQDDTVTDAAFTGSGCAVSQASCDMMCDLVIGKKKQEALKIADNFDAMIKGTATQEQIESLDEAASLQDISYMPSRVKCVLLSWHTMQEMIQKNRTCGAGNCDCGAGICGAKK